MLAAKQPAGAHAPEWCARDVALGKVPAFDLDPPPMVMIIGSMNILWEDLLIMHSPFWTLIHQYLLRATQCYMSSGPFNLPLYLHAVTTQYDTFHCDSFVARSRYSSDIEVRNVTIFNPCNDTIEGPHTAVEVVAPDIPQGKVQACYRSTSVVKRYRSKVTCGGEGIPVGSND